MSNEIPPSKVSIVIPCYNSRPYIEETLTCAVQHDYEDLEIVVIDDGSTDGSDQIIQDFSSQVRSVRTENRGLPAARNLGIEMATGKYLQFLDSDDLILPGKIRRQVQVLEETDGDAVIGNFLQLMDGNTLRPFNVHRREMFDSIDEFVMYTLPLVGRCLYTTKIARKAVGFGPFLRSEDLAFHFNLLALNARWVYSPDELFLYRAHESADRLGGLSSLRRHPEEQKGRIRYVENLLKEHGKFDETARKALSYDCYKIAENFYSLKMHDVGDSYLDLAKGFWDPPVVKGRKSYEILHRILGCRGAGWLMGNSIYALLRRSLKSIAQRSERRE